MTCPGCEGAKQTFVMACGLGGFHGYRDCSTCGGTGEISEQKAAELKAAEEIRRERVERGQTVRERAAELGIGMAELSALEHGRSYLVSTSKNCPACGCILWTDGRSFRCSSAVCESAAARERESPAPH